MTPDRKAREHYAPTWQEQAEHAERADSGKTGYASSIATGRRVPVNLDAFRLPPWQTLLAEGVGVRAAFARDGGAFTVERTADPDHGPNAWKINGREAFAELYSRGKSTRTFGTITPPPPESYTIENIQHFQFLPSVERIKRASVEIATEIAGQYISPAMLAVFGGRSPMVPGGGGISGRGLLDDASRHNIELAVRAEQSHMLYHKAMWRAHGRRVVVLDPTTYTLLAHTDLPAFPAAMLAAPWPAFYIQLPHHAFEFEIQDVRTRAIDRRWAEGVCVAMDHVEPGHEGPRELAFMVMGEDEGMGSEGRNCAFASIRFGPDALLNQFALQADVGPDGGLTIAPEFGASVAKLEYGTREFVGAEDLQVHIPRVIVGLMLYLASEHPDVVPVEPAQRRTFAEVRSPNQRAMALARQAEMLKRSTRLPVLVIGGNMDRAARSLADRLASADRQRAPLDDKVYVRGHWRWYNVGPGRAERVHKWIKPYEYGPDFAEAMLVRAARAPRARMNPHPNTHKADR